MAVSLGGHGMEFAFRCVMDHPENSNQRPGTYRVQLLDDAARLGLQQAYRDAANSLLFLDYDGTLVSFTPDPDMAVPGEELLSQINRLSAINGNELYIISGRSSSWLQRHFGHLPVHLAAEHGARHKSSGGEWINEAPVAHEWKQEIIRFMNDYVHRCSDSFIEEKEFSLVWHYRNAEAEEGERRADELSQQLTALIDDRLQVLRGHKIVEVRQRGIDKGAFVEKVLAKGSYDFVMAAGDDRTDEDMFRCLPHSGNSYGIKVGVGPSHARYYLPSPYMVLSLLRTMDR